MLRDVNRLHMNGTLALTGYACTQAHQHKVSDESSLGMSLNDKMLYIHVKE